MARRRKIGLLFENFGETWTGGEYYLLNIIRSFNFLHPPYPIIYIFYANPIIKRKVLDLQYSGRIHFVPLEKTRHPALQLINRITRKFLRKDYHLGHFYPKNKVDFLFPCMSASYFIPASIKRLRKIYWIPDFQHKHLPEFFSKEELDFRDANFSELAGLSCEIVLSSEDCKKDLKEFYPAHLASLKVISFVSVLSPFHFIDFSGIKKKFNIKTDRYFVSPNQFWAHKNHMVILKAIELVRRDFNGFQIFFTGKENDYRHPNYTESLKQFVITHRLDQFVSFLGFIDRAEQLQLMNNATAIIQPSLFEGWSTVVEDAKALGRPIILSDINVHHEQCGENGYYFHPNDEYHLASLIKLFMIETPKVHTDRYKEKIIEFATQIVSL